VNQISREPLNGFVPNSHGRRVWSLAQTSLNVKGQGHQGQERAVHSHHPPAAMEWNAVAVTRSAQSAVPVPWHRRHTHSTVVDRWIGTCSATEELKLGGMDDVRVLWLVSTSADLLIRDAGLSGNV